MSPYVSTRLLRLLRNKLEAFVERAEHHAYSRGSGGRPGGASSSGQDTDRTGERTRDKESAAGGEWSDMEREFLAALELEQASSFEDVKRAFYRLSRDYHPDRFAGDPQKQQIATEVQRELNRAFDYFKKKFKRS